MSQIAKENGESTVLMAETQFITQRKIVAFVSM